MFDSLASGAASHAGVSAPGQCGDGPRVNHVVSDDPSAAGMLCFNDRDDSPTGSNCQYDTKYLSGRHPRDDFAMPWAAFVPFARLARLRRRPHAVTRLRVPCQLRGGSGAILSGDNSLLGKTHQTENLVADHDSADADRSLDPLQRCLRRDPVRGHVPLDHRSAPLDGDRPPAMAVVR